MIKYFKYVEYVDYMKFYNMAIRKRKIRSFFNNYERGNYEAFE